MFGFMGALTALLIGSVGLPVDVQWRDWTLPGGSILFFSPLIAGMLLVYALDGPNAARMNLYGMTISGAAAFLTYWVLNEIGATSAASSGTAAVLGFTAAALMIDYVVLAIAWEASRALKAPALLSVACALLAAVVLDSCFLIMGPHLHETGEFEALPGHLLARGLLAAAAAPALTGYILWQQRRFGLELDGRGVLSILGEHVALTQELATAQLEIGRRKRAEAALRRSESNYRELVENAGALVLRLDRRGRVLFLNDYACSFLGVEESKALGKPALRLVVPDTSEMHADFHALLANTPKKDPGAPRYFVAYQQPHGETRWVAWAVRTMNGDALRQPGLLLVGTDVTAEKRLEQELRHMATTDSLTGIANRGCFMEQARREFSRMHRHGQSLGVIMWDADHFKQVNDAHGHAAGDALLKELAALAVRESRAHDVVGRLGGEEFGILLTEADKDDAMSVAHRLRAGVEALRVPVDGAELRVTISAGVTVAQPSDKDFETVLNRADTALYAAKDMGRNTVTFGGLPEG